MSVRRPPGVRGARRPALAARGIGLAAILVLALRAFNVRVRPIYRRTRDRLGDINARLQDSLAGIQVVKAFVRERFEIEV